MEESTNIPVLVKPIDRSWQSDPTFRDRCLGKNVCFWCRLTGNHGQSPLERQAIMKQAVLGILVLIILGAILVAAIMLTLRMIS